MLSFRFRDLVHLLLGLCLLLSVLPSVIADEQVAEATVDPDVGTTVVEIIEARGYEVETHKVTASDGYILTMYRIPKTYAESQSGSAANKTAVTVFSTVVGSSFDVEIDDGAKVNKLKKGIAEDQKYDFAASKLQLFLAKTEGGAWVTEADVKNGVKGADESKALDNAGAPLNLVGLSGKDVQFTPTIEDVKAKMTPVHYAA
ncbi:Crinkler (CRN) family protein [Phytophthora cinnamomi]|uniref:Crinkler (CRN) family protein n=1 Tax=Phytophthora cinnamomi TaxID=4785 RepID=UPI002B2E0B75|nr:Crinkler (CRN) family protein [Phytophthora cinnamomi]WNO07216.1 CRN effector protein [Phytophthora cinnamomi]